MSDEMFTESRASNVGPGVMALVFVAMGLWLGTEGEIFGWITAAFFGVAGVGFAQRVIWPQRLELSAEGFTTIAGGGRKRDFTSWSDTSEFRPMRVGLRGFRVGTFIVYSTDKATTGARVTRSLFGYEKTLGTYSQAPDSLADRLNARRSEALGIPEQ